MRYHTTLSTLPQFDSLKTDILPYAYTADLTSLGKNQYVTTVTTLFLYMTIKLRYQTTITTQFSHKSPKNKISHFDHYAVLISFTKNKI